MKIQIPNEIGEQFIKLGAEYDAVNSTLEVACKHHTKVTEQLDAESNVLWDSLGKDLDLDFSRSWQHAYIDGSHYVISENEGSANG